MTKHTPGPWLISEGIDRNGKAGFFVGTKSGKAIWNDDTDDGGICSGPDAQLIAAAPDMLEALRAIALGALDDPETTVRVAEAAIAKATGEKP